MSVALPGMGLVLGSGEVPLARLAERGRPGRAQDKCCESGGV